MVPQLVPQQLIYGLSVPDVCENIVDRQDTLINDSKKDILLSFFNFLQEPANVTSARGVLRFAPLTTGKIQIELDENFPNNIVFVTLLLVEKTLIVTLHDLKITD